MEKVMLITEARYKELQEELEITKQENEKFQQINDELIERLIHVAKQVTSNQAVNEYKMALEIKNKELEQQAKYTAELRSYISSLHEKVRTLNVDRKHHEQRANEFQAKLEEVNRKNSFDLQREKTILDRRVSALYDALEEIQEIVEDVM